jgi:hypothetical protein
MPPESIYSVYVSGVRVEIEPSGNIVIRQGRFLDPDTVVTITDARALADALLTARLMVEPLLAIQAASNRGNGSCRLND